MKLRVAKSIALARKSCRHDFGQIDKATDCVRRAIRRGSRLVSRTTPGWEHWTPEDKT